MKNSHKSHPGGFTRGRPSALPKLNSALIVRLHQTLPCAGCGTETAHGYTWPDTGNPGYYTLLPQCVACAAVTVTKQLPVTLNPEVFDVEFKV